MNWSDWIGFAGSILGGIIGGLFTYLGVRMTLNYEDKKRKQDINNKAYEDRPRLEIVSFTELGESSNTLDDNIAVLRFDCRINDKGETVFIYNDKVHNKDDYISYKYVLKNTGNTEIDNITFVSNFPKDTSIININNLYIYLNNQIINYDVLLKKRFIKPNESVIVGISYIRDQIILSNLGSATIGIYVQDINGRYWYQPLFAPKNEIGNSTRTNLKELKNAIDIDIAIDCFEGKEYW